jgi:hypothetical protein
MLQKCVATARGKASPAFDSSSRTQDGRTEHTFGYERF